MQDLQRKIVAQEIFFFLMSAGEIFGFPTPDHVKQHYRNTDSLVSAEEKESKIHFEWRSFHDQVHSYHFNTANPSVCVHKTFVEEQHGVIFPRVTIFFHNCERDREEEHK